MSIFKFFINAIVILSVGYFVVNEIIGNGINQHHEDDYIINSFQPLISPNNSLYNMDSNLTNKNITISVKLRTPDFDAGKNSNINSSFQQEIKKVFSDLVGVEFYTFKTPGSESAI